MDGWMEGWMDGRTDRQTYGYPRYFLHGSLSLQVDVPLRGAEEDVIPLDAPVHLGQLGLQPDMSTNTMAH